MKLIHLKSEPEDLMVRLDQASVWLFSSARWRRSNLAFPSLKVHGEVFLKGFRLWCPVLPQAAKGKIPHLQLQDEYRGLVLNCWIKCSWFFLSLLCGGYQRGMLKLQTIFVAVVVPTWCHNSQKRSTGLVDDFLISKKIWIVIFFHKKSRVAFVSLCLLVCEMFSDALTRFVVFLDVFCFFEVLDIIPPKNMEFCIKSLQA